MEECRRTGIRITNEAFRGLKQLSAANGLSASAMVEVLIRAEAERQQIPLAPNVRQKERTQEKSLA